MNKVPQNIQDAHQERTLAEGFLYYLSILRHYMWMIIILTGIAAAGIVAFAYISIDLPPERSPMPNTYRAYARLVMQGGEDPAVRALVESLGVSAGGGQGGPNYGQMAVEVMGSRSFLDALVEEFDLIEKHNITQNVRSNSRAIIRGGMELILDRNTGILTIAYTHIDPVFARDVVNKTVELLEQWFSSRGGSSRLQQLAMLEAKLQEVSVEVTNLENQIQEFQTRYGVLRVEQLADRQMSVLNDLRSQLILKEMEIDTYSQFSRIEDPNIIRLRAERRNLQELIREIESGSEAGGTQMPGSRDLPELAREFNRLNTDLEMKRRIYQTLSQQYEVLKLTQAGDSVFQVLEPAEVPDEKAGPQRSQMVIMVTAVTFVLSVMLAFILNSLRKVKSQHEKNKLQ